MSTNIDQRIVEMQFDNAQFEKGVSESLQSLENLKKSLNLEDALTSISNIEKSFSKIDFGSVQSGIEEIAGHFTTLGRNVDKIIDSIVQNAVSKLSSIGKSLTVDQIGAGFSKYDTQTKAVQTITNATGKSVEEVSGVLAKLQKYTDETSYDFAEMASTIGKFTSVGVELSRAETAMEGIANVAAVSGAGKAEANRAMYNFAQSLSQGSVKLMDWKSIENANMATKEFKEELIKTAIELGTINQVSETSGKIMQQTKAATKNAAAQFKETAVDYKTFNSTLSEGWLTSDVLITTLERYSNVETDIGKKSYEAAQKALTYKDAIDAIADAVSSSWMQSFQYMFGDLNEAIDLWTDFCNAIIEVYTEWSSYRNELLQGWHELGGYNTMIEAASNIWTAFTNVLHLVRDAFNSIIPPATADNLVDITNKIKDASEKIKNLFDYNGVTEVEEEVEKIVNYANEFKDDMKEGMSGDYVKLFQQALIDTGYSLDRFGADGIYGSETKTAIKNLQKDLGVKETGEWDAATRKAAILSGKFQTIEKSTETVVKQIGDSYESELQQVEQLYNFGHLIPDTLMKNGDSGEYVKMLQEALVEIGYLDEAMANGVYGPETQAAVARLQKEYSMTNLSGWGIWDGATREQAIALGIFTRLETTTGTVTKTIGAQNSYTERLFTTIQGVASAWNIVTNLFSLGAKTFSYIISLFAPVADGFLTIASAVGTCLINLNNFLNESGAYESWFNSIKVFLQPFATLLQNVGDGINNFFAENSNIKTFTDLWTALRTTISKNQIWKTIIDYLEKFVQTVVSVKNAAFTLFKAAKEWIFEKFTYYFTKGKDGVTGFQKTITDMVASVKTKFDDLSKKYPIIKTLGEYFDSVKNTVVEFVNTAKSTISTFFDSVGNFNSQAFLGWVTERFTAIKNSIATFVSDSVKKFEEFKTKISDAFTAFKDKIEELKKKYPIIDGIATAFETLGTTISSVWSNIKDVFQKAFSSGTFDKGTFFETIKEKFEELKSNLNKTIGYIKVKFIRFKWAHPTISSVFETIKTVIGDIKTLFDSFVETIQNFFSIDFSSKTTFAEKLQSALEALQPVVNWFIDIKNQIVEAWEKIANQGSGGGSGGGFLSIIGEAKKFFEGFQNFNWTSLIGPALAGGTIYALIKGGGIFSSISKSLQNFSTGYLVKNGGKQNDQFGTMMLKIAGSIALIALSIGLLSIADMNQVESGITKIAEVLGTVIGLGLAARSLGGRDFGKDLLMLSSSVAALAIGLGIMVYVISTEAYAQKGDEALKLLYKLLLSLAVIEWAVSKFGGSGSGGMGFSSVLGMCAGLVLIAIAIGALTAVIFIFGEKRVNKAFGIIETLLITLGVISILTSLLSKNTKGVKVSGILGMVAGLLLIAVAVIGLTLTIVLFGESKVNTAFKIIETLLITIGIIAVLMAALQPKISSAIASAIVFISIAGSISLIAYVVSHCLLKIKDVDPTVMEVFFKALEVALAAMVAALLVISTCGINIIDTIEGSAGLIVIATAMGAAIEILALFAEAAITSIASGMETLGYAIEYFSNCLDNEGMEKMKTAKDVLTDYAKLMKENITGINLQQIRNFGTALKDIASNFQIAYKSIRRVKMDLFKEDGQFYKATKAIASLLKSADLQITDDERSAIVNFCNAFQDLCAGIADGYDSIKSAKLTMLSNPEGSLYKAVHQISEMIKSDDVQGMEGVSTSSFENAFGVVSSTVSGFSSLMTEIGEIDTSSLITLIGTVAGILSYAEQNITEENAKKFEANLGKIGSSVAVYYGNIAGATIDNELTPEQIKAALEGIVNAIPDSDVITTIASFATGESKGDELTSFAGGVVNLATAIEKYGSSIGKLETEPVLLANSVIETISGTYENLTTESSWFGTVKTVNYNSGVLYAFANNVTYLGNALESYGKSIGELEENKVTAANSIIETISGTYKNLTTQSSWFGTVKTVNYNSDTLYAFSRNVRSLGNSVGSYIDNTKDADPIKIAAANSVIETLAATYTTITDTSSFMDLLGYISGKKDAFGQFVTDANSLGNAMSTYADGIGGLSIWKVTMANSIINTLANLNVPKTGGFIGWVVGYKDLGKFGDQIGHVGKGIATFCNQLNGSAITQLSDVTINNAATLLVAIAGAKDALETTAQKFASTPSLKNVGNEFVGFGEAMNDFATKVESFDLKKIYTAKMILDDIISSLNSFAGIKGYASVSSFLYDLGDGIFQYFSQLNAASTMQTTIDTWADNGKKVVESFISGFSVNANLEENMSQIETNIGALLIKGADALTDEDTISIYSTNTETLLKDGIAAPINESTERTNTIQAFKDFIGALYNETSKDSGLMDMFKWLGWMLDWGLAGGIQEKCEAVTGSFAWVVNQAYERGRREAGIASPSKLTAWLGRMMDMGLVKGLEEYSGKVYKSAENVSSEAISGAQRGLSDFSSLVFDEMSDEPVIRPVLDLSDVQEGIAGMNGMFGSQTIGVRSTAIAGTIASTAMQNDAVYQQQTRDNSNEIKMAVENLNTRIDELGMRISNMQVVTETGALIGQITNGIDKALGNKSILAKRGAI